MLTSSRVEKLPVGSFCNSTKESEQHAIFEPLPIVLLTVPWLKTCTETDNCAQKWCESMAVLIVLISSRDLHCLQS